MKNAFGFLLVCLVGISSCAKIDDLYKETNKQSSPLFEDGANIPSGFNWSTVKTVDVRVAVDDKFNGQYFYRVELYDRDPMFGDGAILLGAGQAKLNRDFSGKIVVPTALEYIYVRQTSPVGFSSLTMVNVKNATSVNVSKVASIASQSSSTAALKKFAVGSISAVNLLASTSVMPLSTTMPSVTVPANAIELIGNNSYTAATGQAYVVKPGTTFTGTVNLNNGTSGAKVYVQGTWNISSEITIGANSGVGNAIYVLASGTLTAAKITQNNQGYFENYGTAEINTMPMSNPVTYKNYGTLTISNEASIASGGQFLNYGTANIEKLKTSSTSTIVRNEGTMNVTSGDITNASAVEAACHTRFETLKVNGASIYVLQGALLSVGNLDAGGSQINLASSSIFDVTVLAKFSSNASFMKGTGTDKAVARMKKVDVFNQWQAITYSGNLEIACSDHTANGQYNTYYILSSPATMVPYDQSTVTIAGTACNAGGNNDAGSGNNPSDQNVTEVSLGTYSYAFEDNWPSFGDYDMNDFVTDMNITKYQNAANKVTKVKLKAKLRSVGATKRLSAAIQLDGIQAGNVKSVAYSRSDLVGTSLPLTSTGVEAGQTFAIVEICDDAHKAFGVSDTRFISTQNGNFSPVDVEMIIEFNTPLDDFTYQTLNVFIINFSQNIGGRNEVHLIGYPASDKINSSLVTYQTVNVGQLSVGDPFKSHDGYPWGLRIPVSFVYPREGMNISDAYSKFRNWAESGGTQDADWYNHIND